MVMDFGMVQRLQTGPNGQVVPMRDQHAFGKMRQGFRLVLKNCCVLVSAVAAVVVVGVVAVIAALCSTYVRVTPVDSPTNLTGTTLVPGERYNHTAANVCCTETAGADIGRRVDCCSCYHNWSLFPQLLNRRHPVS